MQVLESLKAISDRPTRMCSDMAASSFETWLFGKLRSLNTDHEVFGSYIIGIFATEDSEEDKREALEGILGEVTEDISELCDELLSQWKKFNSANLTNGNNSQIVVDMDAKLASIMEEQARCVVTERQRTAEEQHLREIILAQCNRVDQEEEQQDGIVVDPGGEDLAATGGVVSMDAGLLGRNANTETVLQADKEKREKSKQEHEKKKAQDKLNKEKQKQQQQERKEKEKKRTQKGERKR